MAFTSRKLFDKNISNCKQERASTTNIRSARPKDLDFVRHLAHAFDPFGPYEEILPQWFGDRFIKTFILEEEEGPVGFFMLGLLFPSWVCHTVDLMAIAVLPEKRGCGLGGKMVERAKELARERGYHFLRAHVGCQNKPALNMFRRAGFSILRELPQYYPSGLSAYELRYKLK